MFFHFVFSIRLVVSFILGYLLLRLLHITPFPDTIFKKEMRKLVEHIFSTRETLPMHRPTNVRLTKQEWPHLPTETNGVSAAGRSDRMDAWGTDMNRNDL
jgi:hypothetical protein